MESFELLIIGGGAAGIAAALEADRLGTDGILLCERDSVLGGVLGQCIHHGFGLGYFKEDLTGPEYLDRFQRFLAESRVTTCTNTTVLSLSPDRTALLSSPQGLKRIAFRRCLLASGAREIAVGSLPISGSRPAGVFSAGQAQRLVNLGHYDIGSRIVILGSGNVGQIMARRLTLLGKQVIAVVEQSDALGGLARNRRECIEAFQIPVLLRSTVVCLQGNGRLTGVTVRHLDSGTEEMIPCDTLITAVGLLPERELLSGLDAGGRLPDWLRCAGNCEHIHEIVDAVSTQAEAAVRELLTS